MSYLVQAARRVPEVRMVCKIFFLTVEVIISVLITKTPERLLKRLNRLIVKAVY